MNDQQTTTRVLMIGQTPEVVDLSDPALPPGLTAHAIRSGFEGGRDALRAAGYDPEILWVDTGAFEAARVAERLGRDTFDIVVVGGGLRVPNSQIALFEAVVNTVHRLAPAARIAFNASPDTVLAAVQRQQV